MRNRSGSSTVRRPVARRPRGDDPGTWHHVFNRGIAKRTLFEGRDDVRFFLAELARAVRRGDVEVHAFAVLTTHFHLLLRSLRGRLAFAMQQIQTKYSRRFNRGRKRDGALVRGRYGSKLVDSLRYRRILVGYIDRNAVRAGLCRQASEYPFCSARWYARLEGPPWLERSWVESEVRLACRRTAYEPTAYSAHFESSEAEATVVAARLRSTAIEDPLDDLVGAAPPVVEAWMKRKAQLADGTEPGLPLLTRSELTRVLDATDRRSWLVRPTQKARDGWAIARTALERELCGATFTECATGLGSTIAVARKLYAQHKHLLDSDPEYATRVTELARQALAACRGNR